MTGELAQKVHLVSHFNVGIEFIDQSAENPMFNDINSVRFIQLKKKLLGGYKEVEVAAGCTNWFKHLRANGCKRLRLIFQPDNTQGPDWKLVSVPGGGGQWFIEAFYGKHSDFWQTRWNQKPDRQPDDAKVWNVDYAITIAKETPFEHPDITAAQQKQTLYNALERIGEFAAVNKETQWATRFVSAIAALNSDPKEVGFADRLLPAGGVPQDNVQLVMAAGLSFVFGGLGSWSMLRFDDAALQQEHEQLSGELYEAMTTSFAVGMNRFV